MAVSVLLASVAQLMSYADEFASQSRFYANNGLSRKVMSACKPFGDKFQRAHFLCLYHGILKEKPQFVS